MIQLLFTIFFSIYISSFLSFFPLFLYFEGDFTFFFKSLSGKPFSSIYQFSCTNLHESMIFFAILKNSFSILNDLKLCILLIFQVRIITFSLSCTLIFYKFYRYESTRIVYFSLVFYAVIVHKLLILYFSNF